MQISQRRVAGAEIVQNELQVTRTLIEDFACRPPPLALLLK
jgi:hypothetical protein